MNSVLVTGGAGFIGSNLCEKLLEEGNRVINLDNFNDYYDNSIKIENIKRAKESINYVLVKGDIRERDAIENIFSKYKIDTVVHLAALPGVRTSISNPADYVDVDIKGTVNVLEACKNNLVSKVIFASSSSVYGNNRIPFKEKDEVNFQTSPYAAAKASGELLCRVYNNLYEIPIVCLRFFTVYGPRQRPEMAIHKFVKLIAEGKEISIYGNGNSKRDYTYVEDIVDGIISAINLKCGFEIFNLGNSNEVELNYLINLIEKKLGKTAIKKYMGLQMGDVFKTQGDITKAKLLLGYSPKTSIENGIEKFINWYKES